MGLVLIWHPLAFHTFHRARQSVMLHRQKHNFLFWFMPCRALALRLLHSHSWLPGCGHLMAGPSGRHLFLHFDDYILLHTSDPSPQIRLQLWISGRKCCRQQESFFSEFLQQVNWLHGPCPHIWGVKIGCIEVEISNGRQKRLLYPRRDFFSH